MDRPLSGGHVCSAPGLPIPAPLEAPSLGPDKCPLEGPHVTHHRDCSVSG